MTTIFLFSFFVHDLNSPIKMSYAGQ